MIKEIAQYVENKTSMVIGTDLFAGFRPQYAPDSCAVLILTGGMGDFYVPGKAELTLQAITRDVNYHEAYNRANVIYWLLNGGKGLTLPVVDDGQWIVNASEANAIPQSIGQDEKSRYEFSVNFILRISR